MKLSIVATLYQSENYIIEFYQRASENARRLVGNNYEIILVNDGSPDNSLELAIPLTETDEHLIVINLSRNFGHHKAMMTGLAQAKGELVFLIDSDLEEEPEWMLAFSKKMEEEKCDVIYGVQEKRKGGFFERVSGKLHYDLLRHVMGFPLPQNITTARLMSKRYVDALLRHNEREMVISGLWYLTGFTQIPFLVKKLQHSKTTYTFHKKLSLLVNTVISFSNKPLIFIFNIGLIIFSCSSLFVFYLLMNKLFFSKPISGWTSVMASIWLLGGLIILFIGIIGIYLSKIFLETKQRPYTIIKSIYHHNSLKENKIN